MTQNARCGVGAVNLFGRLDLRQVRELVDRTRDWPDESIVDLNNTDGGSTLMVLRPESGSPTQGLETDPERPSAVKGTDGTGHQDLALQLAKVLKREGDRESTLQFYEHRYWLPIAERLLANAELLDAILAYRGSAATEEPAERTVQEQAQDLIDADPNRFQAERDSEGFIRLSAGHGLVVAGRDLVRVEAERWFVDATRPYFAAQYLAALRLLEREAADITEEPTE